MGNLRLGGGSSFPIREKFFQPVVRQGMFDEPLEHPEGHGANMSADEGGFDDMLGMADAGDQDLSGKVVIFIDRQDLPNKLHAV